MNDRAKFFQITADAAPSNPEAPASKEEQAYRRIKDLLFSGKMVPGQKIIYRDLERFLDMSKTPIVGALARLAQEGMVKLEHNRGYYVRKLEKGEVQQLYELRIRMEEIAVEYAIEAVGNGSLTALRKALEAYVAYDCTQYDTHRLRLDIEFHLQIARLGGNAFLEPLLKQLYDQTRAGLPAVFMTPLIPKFVKDHVRIYEALKARDAKLAKAVIRQHELRTLSLLQNYD